MRHSKVTRQFVLTLIIVFVLQATMLAYVFSAFYRSSVADIKDLGVSNLKSQATMVENYLDRGGNVLWFAAGSVDHLMRNGAGTERLQSYLVEETLRMQEQFDENFTGIYGLLNGEYIDGAGWVPPVGYEPKKRDWYVEGMEGKGKMILSAPYLDAQTGKIIISFTQMLYDGESVLSMDIILNEVQKITEEMTMDDVGYSFIVDGDGLVISHSDTSCVGKDYSEDPDWVPVLSSVYAEQGNEFEMVIDGRRSTVFSDRIEGDWYVVIVADNAVLYHTLRLQILAGILLSLAIYLIVVLFCIYSMKRIQKAEKGEEESLERLKTMNMNVIGSLASTIDAKDRYTSGHSRRVAEYSRELARRMGKSEEEQEIVFTAGLLHDVGKISVPGDVINKPGRLTDEEFDQIRIHPVSGYHILEGIHDDERIGYGAKYHHERYDGKGYPNGLQGEDIPEIARIIAVADAYDAMASDRSYRKLLPQDVVRGEIVKGRGTQFDPEIADIMLQIMDEDHDYGMRQKEAKVKNVMVVDDDDMTLMVVEHILSRMEEVSLVGAHTRQEALDALEEKDIALVILDLKMPDTDGFTLSQDIRAIRDIPVVLMTGDRSLKTIQRIRELGIDDYLTKPLNGAITVETVHSILHRYYSEL
ncbi:MAG: HD domain-containing protein [Lachnospiraceae bacterium]|nr:HD domain-containing protein [Lachnospiraceae bacterium]